jgi:hypothetical protein
MFDKSESGNRQDFFLSLKPVSVCIAVRSAIRDPEMIGTFANLILQVPHHITPSKLDGWINDSASLTKSKRTDHLGATMFRRVTLGCEKAWPAACSLTPIRHVEAFAFNVIGWIGGPQNRAETWAVTKAGYPRLIGPKKSQGRD